MSANTTRLTRHDAVGDLLDHAIENAQFTTTSGLEVALEIAAYAAALADLEGPTPTLELAASYPQLDDRTIKRIVDHTWQAVQGAGHPLTLAQAVADTVHAALDTLREEHTP